ncbi:hypothetical protein SDC9_56422 [bioreactor metagenome]|uniref:Uncharacterized protein n=1 Tax=bioreactor metagenome TaxID=1076179 RepID=A0A644X2T8_9ZZZZ
MKLTHQPLVYLYNNVLDDDIQKCINNFILLVIEMKEKYKTDSLWITDQKIGGIGAYAMPPDPVMNPFPGGIERSLYRPLQYARTHIDICDIRMEARYVVQNCGMHLECVCRVLLSNYKVLANLRFNNTTFGKSIQIIKGLNVIESNIIDALNSFSKVYNMSKHEVNQDENRGRLFNAYEAITAYYSARVLGVQLLRKINFPYSNNIFEINNKKNTLYGDL